MRFYELLCPRIDQEEIAVSLGYDQRFFYGVEQPAHEVEGN